MFGFESAESSSVKMVLVEDQEDTCVRSTATVHRSMVFLGGVEGRVSKNL